MNKYKMVSMGAASLIILAGCLYLYAKTVPLIAVLAICTAAVCIMGGAMAAEVRASKATGFIPYIPAICFFVLAAFICASIVFVLMK